MLLEDYARLYTFRAATITMARHISPRLGWRVRNAANQNHLCPVDGCVWPKGSACAMSECPGRSLSNRAHPPREGAVASLSLPGSAHHFPDLSHAAAHNGEPA